MLQFVLDFFFARSPSLSDDDWEQIPVRKKVESMPELHARGLHALDTLISACVYHESQLLRTALHTFKYKRRTTIAQQLSDYIRVIGEWEAEPGMVFVPVPLHWRRRFDRGFNQTELLAKHAAAYLDIPVQCILKRVQETGHQAHRNRADRMQAMQSAFSLKQHAKVPKHVVLIDDIVTTGATLDACAAVLKQGGAKRVDAWVIARA